MKIPESQFQLFTVEIDDVDKPTLFQTFGDAYECIARASKYATLAEVVPENDSFHVDYYATERINYDGSCRFSDTIIGLQHDCLRMTLLKHLLPQKKISFG